MQHDKDKMKIVSFVTDKTPRACWDWDLEQKNIEFLNGIDPNYFSYIVETHAENLEGKHRQQAALAIRTAYSQALEVLFALLCSFVQAPNCAIGWMLSYNNRELRSVVRKITKRQDVYSRWDVSPVTWEFLSRKVHTYLKSDDDKKQVLNEQFGRLWQRFASDFLNEDFSKEYNSVKHGLRIKPGGFSMAIGIQENPGTPAPAEKMHTLGGSKYGSSYFIPEKIVKDSAINFRPRRQARNWDPYNFVNGLGLLSISINNVICALLFINKANSLDHQFMIPKDPNIADLPWVRSVGVIKSGIDTIINPEKAIPVTKEEILSSYQQENDSHST